WLKQTFPRSIVFDFLKTDVALEFIRNPALLRERLAPQTDRALASPVILDEVQKVPGVLDEVHWLVENKGLSFILCGSSARKLKRGRANLLGGRAWRYEMFPFAYPELERADLLRVLNRGLIPSHYLQQNYRRSLRAYVQDYLKEEVFSEGLVRNISAFSRFFEAMGYSHGELINYANIGRDCGVDSKSVKEYFQILVDTLLGSYVAPFKARKGRQVIGRAPKFYLFDVGVAGQLSGRKITEERGEQFGRALEHYIFMELSAHRSYRELHYEIDFWRTKTGLEVDFILAGGEVAVEVKGAGRVDNNDLKPIRAFIEEHKPGLAIVVSNEKRERKAGEVTILPWRVFLERLWGGEIIK
ncbi:MAG: DUF4143 domain-containing protein, partial [Candidatus Dadabacteria bacterium]|nr:DUF4143 domain-containing protein [Candidatus Dadabacteria bacterium]